MDRKELRGLLPIVLAFAAGAVVPSVFLPAAKTEYLRIEFMKQNPGRDYIAMEREIWHPIHRERVKLGHIKSWSVYKLTESGHRGADEFDFVVLTTSDTPKAYEQPPGYEELFKRVYPKDLDELGKRTADSRRMVQWHELMLVDRVE